MSAHAPTARKSQWPSQDRSGVPLQRDRPFRSPLNSVLLQPRKCLPIIGDTKAALGPARGLPESIRRATRRTALSDKDNYSQSVLTALSRGLSGSMAPDLKTWANAKFSPRQRRAPGFTRGCMIRLLVKIH